MTHISALVFAIVFAIGLPSHADQQLDLLIYVRDLHNRVMQINGTPERIAAEYSAIHDELLKHSTTDFFPALVRTEAPFIIQESFNLRQDLRRHIAVLLSQGKASEDVIAGIRGIFRASRYLEDLVGEFAYNDASLKSGEKIDTAFTGTAPELLTIDGKPVQFQSGDVIMMRGSRFNSAAIARISQQWSQFSHLALIYIDPSGKKWALEALIEVGLTMTPLEKELNEGVGRMVLLRYRDPQHPEQSAELAKRAAEIVYQRAKAAQESGQNIDYDFSMLLDNYNKLFCSKVVRYGYDVASEGHVVLPQFQSRLAMKNRDFFNRIGVQAEQTFAPGDMEVDPHFDLIAEWRDWRMTADMRIKDMVLTKIFQWMDNRNMFFQEDPLVEAVALAAKGGSLLPGTSQLIEAAVGRIPSYMTVPTISTMIMLQETGQKMEDALVKANQEFVTNYHIPMGPARMMTELDKLTETPSPQQLPRVGYLITR